VQSAVVFKEFGDRWDEVNDIHGHYIIWQTASHFIQIVYPVSGGEGLAGILLCLVPFSITSYSPWLKDRLETVLLCLYEVITHERTLLNVPRISAA
jgi:hypothetical protein